ncbi:phage virion morphogenesis protein [Sphingomonas cannabina]|uniref:phage virion morphogenesis protein n=1 Tax=Sphingomonas cannabina TaxID=2899123 RepID=UPI001F44D0A3|nr:phage virion morphogenesis protein [Sphingomonas cannabina]UIJ46903.1 phage virion morphogenesis protein [Sphingomonas cannabina]
MSEPFRVEFQIEDDLDLAFQRAIDAALDMTAPMRDIAGHLADAARDRFETSTGPDGRPWKPSERAKEEGGKTLVLSGDLVNSIVEDWGPTHAAAGPERSGGAAIYARIHQFGGTIVPRVKQALHFAGRILAKVVIPARPYLGWTAADTDYAIGSISEHLARAFRGSAT